MLGDTSRPVRQQMTAAETQQAAVGEMQMHKGEINATIFGGNWSVGSIIKKLRHDQYFEQDDAKKNKAQTGVQQRVVKHRNSTLVKDQDTVFTMSEQIIKMACGVPQLDTLSSLLSVNVLLMNNVNLKAFLTQTGLTALSHHDASAWPRGDVLRSQTVSRGLSPGLCAKTIVFLLISEEDK
ncbi:hypothetical protein BTVI_92984 [Pitangus sulphuratus]|nr:hypothetical protein BTVI_92984 [Pitangus sulphuratus]